ncbi:MAG: thioredoxin family protein [Gilvibacter sp.]
MKNFKNLSILGIYAFALIFGAMSFTEKDTTILSGGYDIGDTVTDVNLKDVNGDMVSFANYDQAKGFIVIFTCNTCPYAVASEDRINALDAEFKDKGYPVIAINPNNPDIQADDTYELMQRKAKEKNFSFPYLYDESKSVYAQFGATKTPHVYILQKESDKLVVKYIGAIDDSVRNAAGVTKRFAADAVNALLDGKEVPLTKTRAIGCSVKV